MARRRLLYAGKDLSAAALRAAGRVRGLSEEIAYVRARLVKRVQAGRATDRFVQEQLTLLARLVVAQSRAMGIEPEDGLAEVIRGVLTGPFGWLAEPGSSGRLKDGADEREGAGSNFGG